MKERRKICLIPLFGAIIFLLMIVKEVKRIGKFSGKQLAAYMIVMGLLGGIGILLGCLVMYFLRIDYESFFPAYLICLLFVWVPVTLPVIEYARKAEKLIDEYNAQKLSHPEV